MALSVGVVVGLAALGGLLEYDGAEARGVAPQASIVGPARVIDGDTVEISGTRIRIQGIDAPEMDDTCLRPDGSAWACGVWSTEAARERFGGRTLQCEDLGERTWGRVVARCLYDGVDVAAAMVEKGAARACPRFAQQHAHSRGYMEIERSAAAEGRGIFDGTPPPLAGFCRTGGGTRSAAVQVSERRDCVIKGNINAEGERIYHMPGQRFYDVTRINEAAGQRWFCTEEEARAAGWRPARH
ncbi:MAG: thermonuclease family protein [Alkalilacustris sp.]